jgi:hypothetical protein
MFLAVLSGAVIAIICFAAGYNLGKKMNHSDK